MNSSKLFFYEPISFDSLLPGGPSSVFNQICFVLFMSLTSNTSCKMMKSSLAENIDELRDDTFVSKLNLESSIQEVLRKPPGNSQEAPEKLQGSSEEAPRKPGEEIGSWRKILRWKNLALSNFKENDLIELFLPNFIESKKGNLKNQMKNCYFISWVKYFILLTRTSRMITLQYETFSQFQIFLAALLNFIAVDK